MDWNFLHSVKSNSESFILFQNEELCVQLGKLDELGKITHAWTRINLQFHTSTENTLAYIHIFLE